MGGRGVRGQITSFRAADRATPLEGSRGIRIRLHAPLPEVAGCLAKSSHAEESETVSIETDGHWVRVAEKGLPTIAIPAASVWYAVADMDGPRVAKAKGK